MKLTGRQRSLLELASRGIGEIWLHKESRVRPGTVYADLVELQRGGFLGAPVLDGRGASIRWSVTDAGRSALGQR